MNSFFLIIINFNLSIGCCWGLIIIIIIINIIRKAAKNFGFNFVLCCYSLVLIKALLS